MGLTHINSYSTIDKIVIGNYERTYMKNRHTITRFFAMTGIILSMLAGSVPVKAAEDVATQEMWLSKTQGIVAVYDTANKPQKATGNMKLLSGYNIATSAASYAWINLDDTKLVEMDALSKVKFTSTGKNYVVDVIMGKTFIDVSKDLEMDESLMICTPGVITSINKGTSAEIRVENGNTTIVGLDGKLDCAVADVTTGQLKSVEVLSGKKVEIKPTASGISVVTKTVKKDDISGFTKLQIAQDSMLKDRVIKASGSKIGNISVTDAVTSASQDMVRQATEVMAVAKESGKDVQSVINAMVGADISAKTLENVGTVTQSAPSSATSSSATSSATSNGSTTDSGVVLPKPVHTHSWDEGVVTKAATCTEDGIRTLTCTGCHQTKEETIPAAHTFEDNKTDVKSECEGPVNNCQEINKVTYKWCEVCQSYVKVKEENKYPNHVFVEVGRTEDGIIKYRCENRDDLIGNDSDNQCTEMLKIWEQEQE